MFLLCLVWFEYGFTYEKSFELCIMTELVLKWLLCSWQDIKIQLLMSLKKKLTQEALHQYEWNKKYTHRSFSVDFLSIKNWHMKTCENVSMSILCPMVCISDAINKASMCSRSINDQIRHRPTLSFSLVKSKPIQQHNEELKFEAKKYFL